MGNNNSLNINSVSKTYRHGKVKANCSITAELHPNEITTLIGHNGAGKTTLLNEITGCIKPDSGEITYQGISLVNHPKESRNLVSIMPQFYAPLAGVTLKQAIESVLRIRGVWGKRVNFYARQIMAELDIEQWADQSGEKLSGGLQRLTSFAMAVVYPAPVILLDEPTNDVDPARRKLVWQYLKRLAEKGHIVLVVTHNLLEAEQYADRYILLDKGCLVRDASTVSANLDLTYGGMVHEK